VPVSAAVGTDLDERARDASIALVGESPAFRELLRAVDRIARLGEATVLLRGETGTGKELIARAIHYSGLRRDGPFVPVNCGALPEGLAENEFFGHERGAFTGAHAGSTGLLSLANGGTLFLDEVDSLAPKAQVALLRFLQDGRYRPLGSTREHVAELRIIAASNKRLEDEIDAGRFRQDLFYRLNLLALDIPPLRARTGDAQVLAHHFVCKCADRYRLPRKRIDAATLQWFDCYGWPGNVRELENVIHREYLLSEADELCVERPVAIAATTPSSAVERGADLLDYQAAKALAIEQFHRTYLSALLERTSGNITKAAHLAGKERRALGKLVKRYRIASAP
jgi:two-component system response regulator GlrR